MTPGGSIDGRAGRRDEKVDLVGAGRGRPDDQAAIWPAGAAGGDRRQSDDAKQRSSQRRRFVGARNQRRARALSPNPVTAAELSAAVVVERRRRGLQRVFDRRERIEHAGFRRLGASWVRVMNQ